MSVPRLFSELVRICAIVLDVAAGYSVMAMMFLVTADVTGRYVFNHPIAGAYEFTEFLMVLVVFFALAYAQRQGSHVRVTALVGRLPARYQKLLEVVALVLFMATAMAFAWQGAAYFWASLQAQETTIGLVQLPLYPVLLAIPLGFSVLSLQLLVNIIQKALGWEKPETSRVAKGTD